MLWFYEKHLSGVVSNLELIPKRNKNENKLLMSVKQNGRLKTHRFSKRAKPQEKLQQNNFSNYFTFFANRNK